MDDIIVSNMKHIVCLYRMPSKIYLKWKYSLKRFSNNFSVKWETA